MGCRPFRGVPTDAPCRQCVRRGQVCVKESARYFKALAAYPKRLADAQKHRQPGFDRAAPAEAPLPPPVRPMHARRAPLRAPSPPPVVGPSRIQLPPSAVTPSNLTFPQDARDIQFLRHEVERADVLAAWFLRHRDEMQRALLEAAEREVRRSLERAKPSGRMAWTRDESTCSTAPEAERVSQGKGKGRAEPEDEDEDDPPAAPSSGDDAGGDYEQWGGIGRAFGS